MSTRYNTEIVLAAVHRASTARPSSCQAVVALVERALGRRRMLLLRVTHLVEDTVARARRHTAHRRRRCADRRVDVTAALAYRDFMVSGYWSRQARSAGSAARGIDLLRGTGRLRGARAWSSRQHSVRRR